MKLLAMTAALIYAQLILGAGVRHTENTFVMISHIAGAFFVLIHVVLVLLFVFRRGADTATMRYPALFLGVVFIAQIALGLGAFMYTAMLEERIQPTAGKIFFLTGHQTLGALLLAAAVVLTLRTYRKEGLA